MNKEKIIKILKQQKNILGNDEDLEEFINLHGNEIFENEIEVRLKFGSYYIKKYGKQVNVEWDSEVEGFNCL
jgi:hypothetical protein